MQRISRVLSLNDFLVHNVGVLVLYFVIIIANMVRNICLISSFLLLASFNVHCCMKTIPKEPTIPIWGSLHQFAASHFLQVVSRSSIAVSCQISYYLIIVDLFISSNDHYLNHTQHVTKFS